MSEAIILYRGRGGIDPESLKPQTITNNGTYTAPVTGNYWVAVVGGGGGGGGGCRNSWNSSQVFYGAGGRRGALGSRTVFLNAGDQVSISLGAGGSGGTNNTTVVSNNSRGSNGGAGATSSFGSHQSGSGGTRGGWSWSKHDWSNVNQGWQNTKIWNNIPIWTTSSQWVCNYCGGVMSTTGYTDWATPEWGGREDITEYVCSNHHRGYLHHWYTETAGDYWTKGMKTGIVNIITSWNNTYTWSNTVVWNNRIVNTNTRCYRSIQQGSWWYTNAENNVSTSGTRTYRGDGGASGRAGNAGFIVIIPPSL